MIQAVAGDPRASASHEQTARLFQLYNSFTVRFGRLGAAGQSQTKNFTDEAQARHEASHLIAEKLKKGCVEKTL